MDGTDALCPCSSGQFFAHCCAPFETSPAISGEVSVVAAHASLRHHLLQLVDHTPEFQEMWFSFVDDLPGPLHDVIAGRPAWELDQARLELFFWDYFQKVSLARPILRVARSIELDDLRSASRLDDWSLAPWGCYQAVSREGDAWNLRHLATGKAVHAHVGFAHHEISEGDGLVARLLKHGGHSFTGLSMLRFPGAAGVRQLEAGWKELCLRMGLPATITLRPDVHNEQWFAFHRNVLELWAGIAELRRRKSRARKAAKEAVAPAPSDLPDLDGPLAALGNQSPREASRHAMGKHRLKLWLSSLGEKGQDTASLRKALGLD